MNKREMTPAEAFSDELERKHQTLARKEIEARQRAGKSISHEWLEALELKYMGIAIQEAANVNLALFD